MGKKTEKKLCWNCDGNVSLHLTDCPYCGVNLQKAQEDKIPSLKRKSPFNQSEKGKVPDKVPKPPYAASNIAVTDEEWKKAVEEQAIDEDSIPPSSKKELMGFLLLLPGIVFFLFALVLVLFSQNGVLTLRWNEKLSYFYFFSSLPLILIGWRLLK